MSLRFIFLTVLFVGSSFYLGAQMPQTTVEGDCGFSVGGSTSSCNIYPCFSNMAGSEDYPCEDEVNGQFIVKVYAHKVKINGITTGVLDFGQKAVRYEKGRPIT